MTTKLRTHLATPAHDNFRRQNYLGIECVLRHLGQKLRKHQKHPSRGNLPFRFPSWSGNSFDSYSLDARTMKRTKASTLLEIVLENNLHRCLGFMDRLIAFGLAVISMTFYSQPSLSPLGAVSGHSTNELH